jgi:uncharacterized protein (TIGR02466 family)
MDIRPLFPTPLIVAEIATGCHLIQELRNVILAREANDAGVRHSNRGGWQSKSEFDTWNGTAVAALMSAICAIANEKSAVHENGALVRRAISWRIDAWANVNRHSASNVRHMHPGGIWSGCFYVDDGGIEGAEQLGGAIEFYDPRGSLPLMAAPTVKLTISGCASAGLGERVYTKAGMLLMFPSWLEHSVTPYTGSGTRISIAFNLSL